ncbi:hypothetical protein C8J57DRAFT_1633991 [Mycena rebaudengoi]|nr:hypothetical protein C8J57DRAFT_1633991 [Mycena rebaudengoi]
MENQSKEKQQLAPDRGRQRRKSKPCTGCLLAVWSAGQIGLEFVDKLTPPHLALYQNETWDQVTNRSAVVRPLISGSDRFDIIATVWLRGNASQQAAYHRDRYPDTATELVEDSKDAQFHRKISTPSVYSEDTHFHKEIRTSNVGDSSWWADKGVRPTKAQDDIFEVALYSGVIIQNATLSDKGLTAEVPLEFPLGHDQPWDSKTSRHPHVISRLHLRMLNEPNLFNLEAYNTVQDKLRSTSCGLGYPQSLGKALPHRSVCLRTYEEAYAPFLSAGINAAGPLDYIPVPVNQVNCSAQASYNSTNLPALEPSLLNDTMKVVWHVSFSGRTPRKMLLSDLTAFSPTLNASHIELERIEAQVQFEHQNTLCGHRFHVDSHPRRRLVSYILRVVFGLFGLPLHIVYYWRLRSTVGISIRGQWLFIAKDLSRTVKLMFNSSHTAENMVQGCSYIFLSVISLSAITRMGFSWKGFRRLPVTFAHATHTERATSRIDAKSSWRFIGMSMLILAMCIFLADPFQRELIPSLLPPDPEAMSPSTAAKVFWASVAAASYMSEVLQLLVNHRARTFGGMYKATAWLMVADQVLHFMVYLPSVLGHIPNREPLSLGMVIDALPLLEQVW